MLGSRQLFGEVVGEADLSVPILWPRRTMPSDPLEPLLRRGRSKPGLLPYHPGQDMSNTPAVDLLNLLDANQPRAERTAEPN